MPATNEPCGECKNRTVAYGTKGDYFCTKCGWNKTMQEEINDKKDEIEILKEEVALFKAKETHAEEFQILLIVGPEQKVLLCHRSLLSFHSSMFDSAFFNGFAETTDGEMDLLEDSVRVVSAFTEWARTGIIPFNSYGAIISGDGEFDEDEITYYLKDIAELWVFADKIMCPRFANAAMKVFLKGLKTRFMWSDVAEYIYENTIIQSTLRQLVLDVIQSEGPFAYQQKRSYRDVWFEALPKGGELIQDIVEAGGFHNTNAELHPSRAENQCKYFLYDEKIVGADKWRKGGTFN